MCRNLKKKYVVRINGKTINPLIFFLYRQDPISGIIIKYFLWCVLEDA